VSDSEQMREQLHDYSDSFSEISQDSDFDITEYSDLHRPDLSDSSGNSDGRQVQM
jgi:hypothetical protein